MADKFPDQLQGLKDRKAQLEDKLKRLRANEISAESVKGDNRQEETISRVETQIREVNTALNKGNAPVAGKTK